VAAQGGRLGRPAPAADEAAVSPAEIQRMFDSYALMQAQEQLQISEERFPQFLRRFKALQDTNAAACRSAPSRFRSSSGS
jgi:hypothetical protein